MTEAVEKKGKPKKLPLPVKLVVGAVAGGNDSDFMNVMFLK
jgi:hypothetical protein